MIHPTTEEIDHLLPKFKTETRRQLETTNYYGYRIIRVRVWFQDGAVLDYTRKQYVREWNKTQTEEEIKQHVLQDLCDQIIKQAKIEGRE